MVSVFASAFGYRHVSRIAPYGCLAACSKSSHRSWMLADQLACNNLLQACFTNFPKFRHARAQHKPIFSSGRVDLVQFPRPRVDQLFRTRRSCIRAIGNEVPSSESSTRKGAGALNVRSASSGRSFLCAAQGRASHVWMLPIPPGLSPGTILCRPAFEAHKCSCFLVVAAADWIIFRPWGRVKIRASALCPKCAPR
jgi:hypothetical protein